jgi:2-C-methyl-D-erythritol 4-phosphate cytidylyltransferase
MTCTAIITAGGSGSRFKGATPKQFLPIHGLPMIVHTLRAFEKSETVDRTIVVLPKHELSRLSPPELKRFELQKVAAVVSGGETRQASVGFGLEAIQGSPSHVAIHDAARCLITAEVIDHTVRACEGWDGAIAALQVRDTIKRVAGERILQTEPRESLWAMQTPQVFRFPWIREAYRKAAESQFHATDDAQVAEQAGGRIRIVEGSSRNFKVTFEEDLILAATLMEANV